LRFEKAAAQLVSIKNYQDYISNAVHLKRCICSDVEVSDVIWHQVVPVNYRYTKVSFWSSLLFASHLWVALSQSVLWLKLCILEDQIHHASALELIGLYQEFEKVGQVFKEYCQEIDRKRWFWHVVLKRVLRALLAVYQQKQQAVHEKVLHLLKTPTYRVALLMHPQHPELYTWFEKTQWNEILQSLNEVKYFTAASQRMQQGQTGQVIWDKGLMKYWLKQTTSVQDFYHLLHHIGVMSKQQATQFVQLLQECCQPYQALYLQVALLHGYISSKDIQQNQTVREMGQILMHAQPKEMLLSDQSITLFLRDVGSADSKAHARYAKALVENVTIQSRLNWKKDVFQKVYDIWDIIEEMHNEHISQQLISNINQKYKIIASRYDDLYDISNYIVSYVVKVWSRYLSYEELTELCHNQVENNILWQKVEMCLYEKGGGYAHIQNTKNICI
jgi:hypothetical protein